MALVTVTAGMPAESRFARSASPYVGAARPPAAAEGETLLPTVQPAPPSRLLPTIAWPLTGEDELAAAAARVTDWPGFLEQARRQNLLGLVAARLVDSRPDTVPEDVLQQLTRVRRAMNRFALLRSGQLLRIVDLLEGAGIPVLPIKGPALSQDLYGDPTLRNFCDLDLVVRPEDARSARDVLIGSGFTDIMPFNERIVRDALESESEIGLLGPGRSPTVDLHWRVTSAFSPRSVASRRLLAGARSLTLLGHTILAPSVEDQMTLGAIHGSFHDWHPLELRLALALHARRLADEAWPRVLEDARQLGCVRRLVVGVAHSSALFSVPLPRGVATLLRADPVARQYLGYLRRAAWRSARRADALPMSAPISYPFWRAASEDRPADALRHLARALMPGPGDWRDADLPAEMETFYWLVRPVRLARKYSRGRT